VFKRIHLGCFALAALLIVGCGGSDPGRPASERTPDTRSAQLPQGGEAVKLDPAEFTTEIDHPYWPMRPRSRWIYREQSENGGTLRGEVTVTDKIKEVAGVKARVIHDVVTKDGRLVEVTDDWYAQDKTGNLWYLGEDTTEYQNGRPHSSGGSWEAGVDGAQAGIMLPADPRVGMTYRQEYYAGEAEDAARVLSLGEQAEVPAGHFTGALLTKDYTPLEPKMLEYKLYAKGVGPVMTVGVSGDVGLEQLVRSTGHSSEG
jgi:major membrane immunogen (membrane-anchored lipoprotein)